MHEEREMFGITSQILVVASLVYTVIVRLEPGRKNLMTR